MARAPAKPRGKKARILAARERIFALKEERAEHRATYAAAVKELEEELEALETELEALGDYPGTVGAGAFPATVGACIDELYVTRTSRLDLQRGAEQQLKPLREREAALEAHIFETFDKDEIGAASGTRATASVTRLPHPNVKDWPKFYAYIRQQQAFDLLTKAVKASAIRERWEAGDAIPGVESYTKVDLSLRKVASGKARVERAKE